MSPRTPQPSLMGRARLRAAVAVGVAAALLSPLFVAVPSASAAELVPVVIDLSKTVDVSTPSPRSAGDNVTYNFTITCSSTQTDCVNLQLTDSFPAPLTFSSVAPNPKYVVSAAPNGFVLTFQSALDEGGIGLVAGETVSFTASGVVPTDVDASYDGDTITNTAFATVDNPDSNNQDSADVVIESPFVPSVTVGKTVTPESVKAFPGQAVNFALSATNSSNAGVTALVIQDPASFPSNAYDYVGVTGISGLVKPTASSLVLVEWTADGTTWSTVDDDDNPDAPAPSANPTLTPSRVGAPLASINGLRFTFTEPGTALIPRGASAGVTVATSTTADVDDIVAPFTATNIIAAHLDTGVAPTLTHHPVVTAQDTYQIVPAAIALVPGKTFSDSDVVGGDDVVVTLTGRNGIDYDLDRLSITEPSTTPGSTSLADQGLEFLGWHDATVEWPLGATSVDVSWVYNTGLPATSSTTGWTTVDTLPDPNPGQNVESFTVTFHGLMGDNALAVVPFDANTLPVAVPNVTETNTITVDAHTTTDLTATADASDDLTRRSVRINTEITKNFSSAMIYANPGAPILLSLPSGVSPAPVAPGDTGGSTIGVTSHIVRDIDADFWDAFDAASIIGTAVPSGSNLTIQYTTDGGGTWIDLPGAIGLSGPSTYNGAIPNAISDVANGIQFVYTPSIATPLLPPGFSVQPNIRAELRAELRSAPGTPVVPGALDVVLVNDATSTVTNPSASPDTVTATDPAPITVRPLPPGGPGYDQIEKVWNDDYVQARSSEQASATISWGTAGLEYDRVVISDMADDTLLSAGDPSLATVADSVYDAFDLVRIPAITPAQDPLLAYDRVVSVELFRTGTNTWVPIASNPCAGTACYGTFPGATLSTAERADTIGVRLTYAENPNRTAPSSSNPFAPSIGSGVAATTELDRDLTLLFELRNVRRSSTDAVLGQTRHAQYNAYDGTPSTEGLVLNTASLDAIDGSVVLFHEEDGDTITILDSPINLNVTKTWVDGPLGQPTLGTPQALYPSALMTVTAQNASDVPVNRLSLTEPTMVGPEPSPFDFVTITRIVATPGTSASSMVTLTKNGVDDAPITLAAATALLPAALVDVTGVTLSLTGPVAPDQTIGLQLHTQLREFVRGTASTVVPLGTVLNRMTGTIVDPGGLQTPVSPSTDNVLLGTATASIDIVTASYDVTATKTIIADTTSAGSSPAIQYDGNSTTATVRLTGQPSGTARTTRMIITDSEPTFWNAYTFAGLDPSVGFVSPVNRVKIDLLMGSSVSHTGVDYDTTSGITSTCTTNAQLDADCWLNGTSSSSFTLPTLPAGYVLADVRGIRYTFTKADGTTWERPYNPTVNAGFRVDRREYLVSPSTTLVPSTLTTFVTTPTPGLTSTPAPGEADAGIFSNTVRVVASAATTPTGPSLWSATDDAAAQIRYQHLPARVTVTKTPFAAQSLGSDIPYRIVVTNSGSTAVGAHDKPLGEIVVTDSMEVDSGERLLVFPSDPNSGVEYDPEDTDEVANVISYRFANAANVTQTTGLPAITVDVGVVELNKQDVTFTVDPSWQMPVGWSLTITMRMQFAPQLEAGREVLNSATVTADQVFDTCNYTTDGSFAPGAQQTVGMSDCTATTRVWPLPSAPVTIVKGVRGLDAGPLDASGNPIEEAPGDPYDDLGILKTVAGSKVSCDVPNVSTGLPSAAEYYRYPCVPITRPGGYEEWAATFVNGGNIGLKRLVAIDVLPAANDRGVIVNESRGSRWTPTLTSYPELVNQPAGSSYDVYYVTNRALVSTRCNGADIQNTLGMVPNPPSGTPTIPAMTTGYQPCLTSSANPDDIAERNAAWTLLDPATPEGAPLLATIVALKFVLVMDSSAPGVDLIDPGEKVSFVYRSRTAASIELAETNANLDRDSIAYNSIAAAASAMDGTTEVPNRFVTEPRKVGVAMATGEIQLSKVVDGLASTFAGTAYNINLSCTSTEDNVPIAILDSTGANRSPVSVSRGTTVVVRGLPLYAECGISEAPTYGQTATSYSAPSVTAQQAEVSIYDVRDPHPVFGPSRPDIELSTITNTYDMARLTVTKAVTATGRTTEGGSTAPNYNNFAISVNCTFNNGTTTATVLNVTNQTLTATGPTATYTSPDIPAGSVCTVTETQRRNAATIGWSLTQGPSATPVTTSGTVATTGGTAGRVAPITLTRNEGSTATNALTITNNFTSFALTVNKAVAGAWAANHDEGSFTVNVNCTLAVSSGTAVSVFTGSATFTSPGTLSHVFPNIATGSVCTVNEPVATAGGAVVTYTGNGQTMSTNRTTTVTNTFNNASLAVTKTVQSTAVDGGGDPVYLDAPYVATVSCVFGPSNTPVYPAESPAANAVITFTEAELGADRTHVETLTELPAGATCTVTETSATPSSTGSNVTYVAATSGSPSGKTATFALAPIATRTNTATINNNYGVEHFIVEKSLHGAGAAQFGTGPFVIHVNCMAGAVETYDADITLPLPGNVYSYDIGSLAAGSECTAVESNFAATGADAIVYRDGAGTVISPTTPVDASGANPRVVVENWYLSGQVTVSKAVDGAGAAEFGAGPFEITIACERDGDVVTLTNPVRQVDTLATTAAIPSSVTFTGIPTGSECTITETDPADATTTTLDVDGVTSPATVSYGPFTIVTDETVLADNQAQAFGTVAFTNTFDVTDLAVTKLVDGDAVDELGNPISYGPFPFDVQCDFNGSPAYGSGYSAGTPMTNSLAEGVTWTITGLPVGAECTVTESSPMDAVDTVIVTTAGGVAAGPVSDTTTDLVLGSSDNETEFTNVYDVGSLSLAKVVDGAARDDWGTADFEISVVCTITDAMGFRTVWDEDYTFDKDTTAPVDIENLVAGSTCTITESTTGTATETVIDIDGVDTTGTVATTVITNAAAPTEVVVTNTFDYTSVEVTKTRSGDIGFFGDNAWDLWGEGPFEVTLECTFDGSPIAIPGGATRSLDGTNGYLATYDLLPVGAACAIDETQTGAANASTVSDPTFTTTAGAFAVDVENEFYLGDLSVAKSFSGLGSGIYGNTDFEVTLTCERVINGATETLQLVDDGIAALTAANGYAFTYRDLPVGAECSLEETNTGYSTVQTIGAPVTIERASVSTVAIDLDNEFLLGDISFTKEVLGAFVARAAGSFDVTVDCTYDLNGVATPLVLPGGPTITIRAGETVEFENLPVDTTCEFDELGNGGADVGVYNLNGIVLVGNSIDLPEGENDLTLSNLYLLAHNGTDSLMLIFAAMLTAGTGIVIVAANRKRRAGL